MTGVVVVSSCTSRKVIASSGVPAEALYAGQQHIRLMRGVHAYRAATEPAGNLQLRIISALHGVLAPDEPVAPYDFSYASLSPASIRDHAAQQAVPEHVAEVLAQPFRLGMLLLSEPYLRACALSNVLEIGGPVLAFCSPYSAQLLPPVPALRPVVLTNREARRFACGLVSLKGEFARRVLTRLAADPTCLSELIDDKTNVLTWLEKCEPLEASQQAA